MVNKEFLKRLNILYVEDEFEAATKLVKFLNRVFNNVYLCLNGQEALETFSKKSIDLVISDINMPIVDGLKMSEKIKEINSNTPIILTTARTETQCLIKAIELNIDSYLLKPIELDILIEKIYAICEKIEALESKKILKQYKEAIDESTIVVKFNTEGKITFVNSQYEKVTGFSLEDVKDKIFNFNSIEKSSILSSDILKLLESKKFWKGKHSCKGKNHKKYVLNSTVIPIRDSNEKIIEFICISNDVTDDEGLTKLLKVELEEFKDTLVSKSHLLNEYKRCLDNSSILINLDRNFRISNVNSRFLELSNLSINAYLGKSFDEVLNNEEIYGEIFDSLVNKNIKQKVIKFLFKGKEKYIDFTFSPVFNEESEVFEYLAVGNDVSKIIELQLEIEKTQKDLILTLGSIGESRSKETANHVRRVALYSYLLAKEYGLSEDEATLLKMASPMHDIGKVGIPDYILNKPDKLTQEEFEIMKSHTTIGFNMFKNSERRILKSSSIVAHEHHEKWDGTGYPNNLKGKEIHVFGRITAVADVFDALSSKRCYKRSWDLEEIKEYMREKAGKEFEPKLVDLLFKNINKIVEIRNKYKD
ncbi:HD domain-containing phosphohydrolase [Halarcobacter anaerophilus]|uniref:response regulator n=1 Tax=Halarcobacter anaerophilus TaxID=877500 RepID=UPI0005C9C401|nr:HD domain-containing phosphohydrolase [Halarcobacter anaerophilus]